MITRRRLPPPAASTVYELTESGARPRAGARGARPLGAADPWPAARRGRDASRAGSRRRSGPPWPRSRRGRRVAFSIGGRSASLDRGHVVPGLLEDADATVRGAPGDLYALLVLGDTAAVSIEGDREAVEELIRIVGPPRRVARSRKPWPRAEAW